MSLIDSPTETPNPTASSLLDDIPPLTTQILQDEDDQIAALKLVADSIAQQRQFAAKAVILHPLTIVAWIGLLAILAQFLLKTSKDIGLLFTTSAGATMACLVGVRALTSGYLALAEGLTWDFVRNDEGEEDLILGSRFGDELIGALVLRLEKGGGGGKKKSGKKGKGGNGVVRAWTVRNRYRGKGVGTELLEEAVRVTRDKLGRDAGVGFAAEHANSKMVLPDLFNLGFRKRETQAGRMLEGVVAGMEKRKR
ncbi:uncharacterized protein L3040_001111 [Drepanopeziza brunnea f. sp. 'multigermtubi']|uniref:Acetyltransferase n=1 Tax=Marssonina brunnea f. sp. multigermtubi (strain MB_m1) TaxID=1072389 RepID=K1WWF8_MARBU|nr:acetyltransferase [Drepanopeziza brunnea f. sp. 'multigermtubi' MB_m1]EKD16827.1 acetyltransferase [Drepanopeziza brunnea f. sp. 'multigermtubi' MB_m1]KAJ5054849.1 hypothetical protein L3040_001111 [Drepanopeziza brunnea f. sp. 'multigermtubi']